MLGVMIDCSRNAVMSPDTVKHYAGLLSRMGYDTLMLYTEDTYEVDGEPYFGYLRGRYTKEELKELDAYCNGLGIELIPCIQTLAHLNSTFQISKQYEEIRDCDDILLIDHPRTYELIDHMLASLSECFTTRKIHIGMDEASKVGLGKYLAEHGYTDRFELINRHLHKVCDIADRYGFKPMIWSDMFCQLAMNITHFLGEGNDNIEAIKKKSDLPESISLVYWDYYSDDYDRYMKNLAVNKMFGRPVVFAGGAWTWRGLMPDNSFSIANTAAAFRACHDSGVEDVFLTVWGDDGNECSRFAILPSLYFAAEAYRGNTDIDSMKAGFKQLTGCDWEAFMLLETLDHPGGAHDNNPSKYLLYNDPFLGLNDYRATHADAAYYKGLAPKLDGFTVSERYRPIFESAKALCELLSVKADLGLSTREAYAAGDKAALKTLAEEVYPEAIVRIERFNRALWKQWSNENKPFGFDIQDFRQGGAIQRLKNCRERLLAYVNGELDRIPELEEALLPGYCQHWPNMSTPSVVTHTYFG